MPRKIIVVRHGERIDHVDRSWRETAKHPSDSPLTEKGLAQALSVGKHLLETEHVDRIYVSPFTRTLETGTQIADLLDLPLYVETGICEFLNPAAFGRKGFHWPLKEEAERKFPRVVRDYESDLLPLFPETRAEMQARTKRAVEKIVDQHCPGGISDDSTIVIISHGSVVEACVMAVTEKAVLPYVNYCSMSHVIRDGDTRSLRFRRGKMADTSFMDSVVRPADRVSSYN